MEQGITEGNVLCRIYMECPSMYYVILFNLLFDFLLISTFHQCYHSLYFLLLMQLVFKVVIQGCQFFLDCLFDSLQ